MNIHGKPLGIGALIQQLSNFSNPQTQPFADFMQVSAEGGAPDRIAAYEPGDKYRMMSADPNNVYPPNDPVPYIEDPQALHAAQQAQYAAQLAEIDAQLAQTVPASPEYYELRQRRDAIAAQMR